ncbi:thiol reductant ABC exporter subunit CydD [Helcobacillus massiliensis]|uniref:ATP-binding cassette subfamily C protein CydD n=1 Tax=Helcobacillus massiliensis TaxID=521392 RepID=A0A839R150_9MICO|nr:ATP-binding cassette subfamily C protein CydD [Helcobacillus massiliensis]
MARRQPPLDPRLISEVRSARQHLALTVAAGLVEAVAMITVAWCVGRLGAAVLQHNQWPLEHPGVLGVLTLALAVRALTQWVRELTGHRAATRTIAQLRQRFMRHLALAGPRGRVDANGRPTEAASSAALATTGLEALRPYMTGYVPQLALAATVTPLALLAIAWWDLTSAIVALVAIPLIPVFMILIGRMTENASQRSLGTMRTLWSQTLDLVEGLPTLRALGRERGSEQIVEGLGREHKSSAMRTLAFAFLSSFVLELIATLGVALIAVSIGLRLVYAEMELFPAIAVLVLAAEVYLPLRLVGQQFHASADGVAALDAAFAVLTAPLRPEGSTAAPDLRTTTIRIEDLSVTGRDSTAPAGLNVVIEPGGVHALTGPSGCGKSTAVSALLGLLTPTDGRIVLEPAGSAPIDLADVDLPALHEQVTWLPQRPVIGPGTIREILTGSAAADGTAPDDEQLRAAMDATGLGDVIDDRGWDAVIGRGGTGLSVGQRQRVALTAALLQHRPLVILDEPTAHLDGESEDRVIAVIDRLRDAGSTVLIITHRTSLLEVADRVTPVRSAVPAAADETAEVPG